MMDWDLSETEYDEHEMFDELAAGHALHALDEIEAEVFCAHLQGCSVCQEALVHHRSAAGALAYAVTPTEAPPALLDRIRAEVVGTPQHVDELARRRDRRGSQILARSTAALSAAAGVVLVVALISSNSNLREERDQQVAFGGQISQTVKELTRPGTSQVVLTGSTSVAAVALVHEGEVALVVDELAPTDPNSTYVLWKIRMHGEPQAVGTFDVEGRELEVVSDLSLGSYDQMTTLALTREAGRSAPKRPQSPILASGRINA